MTLELGWSKSRRFESLETETETLEKSRKVSRLRYFSRLLKTSWKYIQFVFFIILLLKKMFKQDGWVVIYLFLQATIMRFQQTQVVESSDNHLLASFREEATRHGKILLVFNWSGFDENKSIKHLLETGMHLICLDVIFASKLDSASVNWWSIRGFFRWC